MMTAITPNYTDTLVAFIYRTRGPWSPEITKSVNQVVLGYAAAAAHGWQDPVWQNIRKGLSLRWNTGPHWCVGQKERLEIRDAVFLNAIAGNAQDFDDTHVPTIIHPCSIILPVVMAVAQEKKSTSEDMIRSILMGYEVMCRLGKSVHPEHYQKGYHITATCGVIGAAVSAALLMNLNELEIRNAIAIATGQASGLIENLATQAKAFAVGAAARDGIMAAEFAQQGLLGPADPLGGKYGFMRVLCSKPDTEQLILDLGKRWEISNVAYKPYPVGVVLNPVIEAALALRRLSYLDLGEIDKIEVRGHKLLLQRTNRPTPEHSIDARLSTQHTVAAAMVQGFIRGSSFSLESLHQPEIKSLSKKIYMVEDDRLDVESVELILTLRSGDRRHHSTSKGLGSLANPMSTQDLAEKLHSGLTGSNVDNRVKALIDKSIKLDSDLMAHNLAQTIAEAIYPL